MRNYFNTTIAIIAAWLTYFAAWVFFHDWKVLVFMSVTMIIGGYRCINLKSYYEYKKRNKELAGKDNNLPPSPGMG